MSDCLHCKFLTLPYGESPCEFCDSDYDKFSPIHNDYPEVISGESSPHGIPLGAPGCKLSAGKPKLSFAIDGFPLALKAVAAVGQFGHEEKGYGLDSWKTVPDGEKEYHEARYRHQADIAKGEYLDSQSRYPHLFHIAWNALAELELHIQNNPDCFKRDK